MAGFQGFPPKLKKYVERVFASVPDRTLVESQLKTKIQEAVRDGRLWTTNWDVVELVRPAEPPPVQSEVTRKPLPDQQDLYSFHNKQHQPKAKKRNKKKKKLEPLDFSQPPGAHSALPSPSNSWSAAPSPKRSPSNDNRGRKNKKRQKKDKRGAPSRQLSAEEELLKAKRAKRFQRDSASRPSTSSTWNPYEHMENKKLVAEAMHLAEQMGEEADLSQFVVVGTSTELEKQYLRLTSAPDPSKVRPQPILVNSLAMVLDRFGKKQVEYLWVSEQLKAIRQDLTVQHIKNEFTAEVYEAHARLALRNTDMKEFNQCQTQLQELYEQSSEFGTINKQSEFAAYGILYNLYTRYKYGATPGSLGGHLQSLSRETLESHAVNHALAVQSSIDNANYTMFFQLYRGCPNEGRHLLKLLQGFVRHLALLRITKSFRPNFPVSKCRGLLQLADDDEEWDKFVSSYKLVLASPSSPVNKASATKVLDTKASQVNISEKFQWEVLDGDNVTHLEGAD